MNIRNRFVIAKYDGCNLKQHVVSSPKKKHGMTKHLIQQETLIAPYHHLKLAKNVDLFFIKRGLIIVFLIFQNFDKQ